MNARLWPLSDWRSLIQNLSKEIKRAEAQSRYQQIARILGNRKSREDIDLSKWDDYSEVLTSPLIQTLRAQEIKV